MPAETAVGLSLDAHTLLTTLCQLGCEVGHVQVRVHVYTGCIKCRFLQGKDWKKCTSSA